MKWLLKQAIDIKNNSIEKYKESQKIRPKGLDE